MPSWGLVLLVVCIGLFLAAELLSWRADLRRNPDRKTIRKRAVLYRVEPVRVHHARSDGKDQNGGFRGFKLVVRDQAIELSHVIPGNFFLLADWYRYSGDVQMDFVKEASASRRSGVGVIRLTMRSGVHFYEVWLLPSAEGRKAVWDALAGAGVRTGSGLSPVG